ncbi:MAG: SPASM domain-containing protein, partial [Hyphomicrobiales bacterium]|nr:SPASM domain-containing protein [Hyphomicrobiales bacterium]
NRARLMPTPAQVERARALIEELRERHRGRIVIDAVVPDYHARYPKPCSGGWARRSLNVTPTGMVLPCHAAQSIACLEFWNVRDHSLADIWRSNPAFKAFRGTDWMPEPCRSCDRREIDWGGCRCQALALTGDARNTDPASYKSPHHERIVATAMAESESSDGVLRWRSYKEKVEA